MTTTNLTTINPKTSTHSALLKADGNSAFLQTWGVFFLLTLMNTMFWGTPAYATVNKENYNIKTLAAIGLTEDGYLVRFKTTSPRRSKLIGHIEGFDPADTRLVGIDYRVQNGLLYGVGNGGGIYTIDTNTAKLTLVSKLSQSLDPFANYFGVDFNPAANRLRIISDQGQNLAHNLDDGATAGTTVVNGVLNDPPPATAGTVALGITGAAYTNNDLAPAGANTATTLFNIDTVRDQISIQSPPGAGTLTATGKLGVDTDLAVGFDIYSQLKRGVTVANYAFASLRVNGNYAFYSISPLTGQAYRMGWFNEPVIDIAIPLNQ